MLASICLIQAAYPTLLGWVLASLTYGAFAGLYLLWGLLERNQLRQDPDRHVLLMAFIVLLAISSGLLFLRPKDLPPPPD